MTRFVRQDHAHQAAADDAWRRSEREIGFMGEWHTHPWGQPEPSWIDRANWATLAAHSGHPMCFLLASPQVTRQKRCAANAALAECERGALGVVLR